MLTLRVRNSPFWWGMLTFFWLMAQSVALSGDVQRDPVLDAQADAALSQLFHENLKAAEFAKDAEAVLVFPSVGSMGIWLGGESGYGVLRVGSDVDGYYRTFSITVGVQGGFQTYSYVIFFMTPEALDAFRASERFELGANGSVAVAASGATADTEPARPRDDTHGFIFNETGLMIGATVKASTITRLTN